MCVKERYKTRQNVIKKHHGFGVFKQVLDLNRNFAITRLQKLSDTTYGSL